MNVHFDCHLGVHCIHSEYFTCSIYLTSLHRIQILHIEVWKEPLIFQAKYTKLWTGSGGKHVLYAQHGLLQAFYA